MWVYHFSWLPGSENTSPVSQESYGCAAYPRTREGQESESSSVPAGSFLSVAGVGGLLAAGVALLFLITGLIGFALRPVVDEAFNR
ncbi:hypothetical protein [Corynebacterium sp. p3-SID1194]|uniref:hypothetical protein n=1 Tax=Corynebacterium sp. p3-SID1194 TaxID=2916105 RepID=UPI0021A37241|nr:hypothetical protein [Corynebacterium sp. p3-SID1194]MCT1451260.1 hypothetical protein [Corynebacterium sp. p3-SID1194]